MAAKILLRRRSVSSTQKHYIEVPETALNAMK
jgi:hypothetical protein